MGKIFKYISILLATASLPAFAQDPFMDSLKLSLKNAKHDTTRCVILNVMVETEGDDNIWPKYNQQLLKLVEKNLENDATSKLRNFYLKYLGNTKNNIGAIYDRMGQMDTALIYYEESLKIRKEINDKIGIAGSAFNIGVIFYKQGDISTALDYFYKSLKLQEEVKDKMGLAGTLNIIGVVYTRQDDNKKAFECFSKSLKLQEEIGDKRGAAASHNYLGLIYDDEGNFSKAIESFQKSLKLNEETRDYSGIAYAYNNIGAVYAKQGYLKESLTNLKKALGLLEKTGNKQGISLCLNDIAALLTAQGELATALPYATRSLIIAKETGFPEVIRGTARILKDIFQRQNKYKEAFDMYALEIKMQDSVNNEETQKAIVKNQIRYAYEKKELVLKTEQEKKDILVKEELKRKEKERNYFIAGFGLVLVLAGFIFRGYKQTQKTNLIIAAQKDLVDEKQKEILDSIHYAKRIQTALLPSNNYFTKNLNRLKKS